MVESRRYGEEARAWLAAFGSALAAHDIGGAAALFGDEGFWRDLAVFTWNVKTLEGRDAIAAMLGVQLGMIGPTTWRIEGEPTLADGVLETWISFETKISRGRGILRLRNGRAWTLLTAIEELKGFEERKGRSRPLGVAHGVYRRDKNWLEAKRAEEGPWGAKSSPIASSSAAARAASRLGRA